MPTKPRDKAKDADEALPQKGMTERERKAFEASFKRNEEALRRLSRL